MIGPCRSGQDQVEITDALAAAARGRPELASRDQEGPRGGGVGEGGAIEQLQCRGLFPQCEQGFDPQDQGLVTETGVRQFLLTSIEDRKRRFRLMLGA